MAAFTYRIPAGIPGTLTRAGRATVEPVSLWPQGSTGAFLGFGLAGVEDVTTGQFRVVKAGDTFIHGFIVRNFPQSQSLAATQGLGQGVPLDGIGDVMRRGYMSVKLYGATAAKKGGQVFIRLAVPGAGIIGGVEALADAGNTLALSRDDCWFEGPADADGNVEIAYRI